MFPDPLFLRDCGLTHSAHLWEGLTEQCLGAGHTQKGLRDHAAADAQRLWLGASPPQKKFTRPCSSSVSGTMANHNTHLAPGFTPSNLVPAPVNVVVLLGPLCLCLWAIHTASTRFPPSRETGSPCVALRPPDFTLLLEIHPSHQSTARYQAVEFQTLHSPCLQSLNGI